MKPYNEQEFNKLCAEFLGGKIKEDGWNFCLTDFGVKHCGYGFHEGFDLKFHSDWNWIMEVVEKISNIPDGVGYVFVRDLDGVMHKKQVVVESIWQFLNWYNEQK